MGYIDTYINEGTIQEDLASVLAGASANWTLVKTFHKAVYDQEAILVARHTIFGNSNLPNSYLGMAVVGNVPYEEDTPTTEAEFSTWLQTKIDSLESSTGTTKVFTSSVLYFYTLENLPSITDDAYVRFNWKGDPLQGVLDIECWGSDKRQTGTDEETGDPIYKAILVKPELNVMQSPISCCITRYAKEPIEDLYNETYEVFQNHTNWWFDSKISVKGYVDDKAIFLILQADTTPAWEDNIVPSIPLYFGLLEPFKDDSGNSLDYNAVAFFAGTAPDVGLAEIPKFDFDDYDKTLFQTPITPILKEYPRHPSNGVDTVTVQRARKGARYQAYYLSWNTVSDDIIPDRSDKHVTDFSGNTFDRDYPRAWMHSQSDEYMYWFNPSRYSGKIHTSKIYVMHPEEGLVGSLYHAIGMSAVGIVGGKIRVLVDPCGTNKYEYYRYSIVDGISPLTKRPGTVYRPIGLGILDDTPII